MSAESTGIRLASGGHVGGRQNAAPSRVPPSLSLVGVPGSPGGSGQRVGVGRDCCRKTHHVCLSRYLAAYGSDVEAFSFRPIPTFASLPEVEESTSALIPANGPPACSGCRLLANQDFGVTGLAPQDLARQVKLLSGRMPNQSNPAEVLASYTMQRDLGIHFGSHIRIRFASQQQRNEVLNGAEITPDGPLHDFKVVGTEASEDEFPTTSGTNYRLYATKAFLRSINDRTVLFHADLVRLRHGAADLPRFQAQARQDGVIGTN